MAIDFKKLFSDKTKYSDDLKMTIGDAEVTLGDLRAYDASVGGELQKELKRQMSELETERNKVKDASEKVATMFVDLERQKAALDAGKPAAGPTADPLASYEADPVFGPITKALKAQEAANQKLQNELTSKVDALTKSIAQMGTTYMGDKASQDFASIMATDDPVRPADLSLDRLYKFAVENRVYDRNSLPDMKEAYKRLTADARHKHEIAEAERRGAETKQREIEENALLPRPVSGLPPLPEGFKPPTNLGDAFSRAGGDRDLWKTIHEASASAIV